jgi:hypothetical protein
MIVKVGTKLVVELFEQSTFMKDNGVRDQIKLELRN